MEQITACHRLRCHACSPAARETAGLFRNLPESRYNQPKTHCQLDHGPPAGVAQCPGEKTIDRNTHQRRLTWPALVKLIDDDVISGKIAKTVFEAMAETGKPAKTIVEEKGLIQVSDTTAIDPIVDTLISEHPDEVARYRGGNRKLIGFFVGQVMKQTRGKANPKVVNEILRAKLG